MTLSLWQLALALLGPYLIGRALLARVGIAPRQDGPAVHVHAALLGALSTALLTLLWCALHRPLPGTWLAPLLALGGAFALLRAPRASSPRTAPLGIGLTLLLGLLALWLLDVATVGNLSPILVGDEANIWASKAKVLGASDGLGLDYTLRATFYPVQHRDYPLLVPLLHLWLHAAAGQVTHIEPRLWSEFAMLGCFVLLVSGLRGRLPLVLVIALLLAFAGHDGTARLAVMAGGDAVVALGLLAAVDAWQRFRTPGHATAALPCAVALAVMAWSKNEGVMLLGCFAAAVTLALLIRKLRRAPRLTSARAWAWFALPIAVVAGQSALDGWWGFGNDMLGADHTGLPSLGTRLLTWLPERAGTVLAAFGDTTLFALHSEPESGIWNGRLLLLLGLLAPLCAPKALLRSENLVPWLCLLGGVAGYFCAFVVTPNTLSWHLETAAARILFHLTPLAVLVLGRQLAAGLEDGPLRRRSKESGA